MGFNKRFVSVDTIKMAIDNNLSIVKLFDSDAVIFMDDLSSEVFKMVSNGISDSDVKKTIHGKLTNY